MNLVWLPLGLRSCPNGVREIRDGSKFVTKKGAVKDVTRVSGQAAPGLRIADPREGHLQAATWVDNHTRGGGEGSRKRRKVPGMIAHTHMPM